MSTMEINLQEIHDFAISLAKDAGTVMLEASKSRLSVVNGAVKEKKNCILHTVSDR